MSGALVALVRALAAIPDTVVLAIIVCASAGGCHA